MDCTESLLVSGPAGRTRHNAGITQPARLRCRTQPHAMPVGAHEADRSTGTRTHLCPRRVCMVPNGPDDGCYQNHGLCYVRVVRAGRLPTVGSARLGSWRTPTTAHSPTRDARIRFTLYGPARAPPGPTDVRAAQRAVARRYSACLVCSLR